MAKLNDRISALSGTAKLAVAAVLLAAGGVVGAGAAHLERPSIEMAPTNVTPISKLASSDGIVTVRGRVAESFGDSFIVADASGRTLIAAGRETTAPATGSTVTVQGRADDGKLRPSFLVDAAGTVMAMRGPGHGPHGRGRDRDDGPRPGPDNAPQPPAPAPAPAPQSAKPVPAA